ncbi:hypothetical protein [Streptomyces sp. NPDC001568]|uniref:hypothetical protein n=1 Tax=Streptomyces sp. NPDC001568 TaxID=3364588 RepID=UPI0036758004
MRAYAGTGYLSPGDELYGRRRWARREITARQEVGDQRAAASTSAVQALTDQLISPTPRPPPPSRPPRWHQHPSARRRIAAARQQLETITAEGGAAVITEHLDANVHEVLVARLNELEFAWGRASA